jgi:hypothetical protein
LNRCSDRFRGGRRRDAEQRLDEARLVLNQQLGRHPGEPLELVAVGPPQAPRVTDESAWQNSPEIVAAEAEARSAEAGLTIAGPEASPPSLNADLGFWVSDTQHLTAEFWDRFWAAKGYSLSLMLAGRCGTGAG